jgi:hypothetical protein
VSAKVLKFPFRLILFDTVQLGNSAADCREIVAAGKPETANRAACSVAKVVQFPVSSVLVSTLKIVPISSGTAHEFATTQKKAKRHLASIYLLVKVRA